nr:hypothetical protein [Tanacetum cinerariifolium]
RVIEGVVQHVAPTTAEQRLARKNKLKARVSVIASVSTASAKIHVSALPNVDTLSNAIIYSFFASLSNSPELDNDDLKTGRNLGANGPTSMGFDMSKVKCYNFHRKGHFARGCSYDCSFQAEKEPTNYALMAFTSSSSFSSDNEVSSCSQACTKAYATLQSHYDKLTYDFRKSQFDVISYKTGLESVEARLLVYQQNEFVFEEDIKLLKLKVQLRDNALVVLRPKFEQAEQERDDLKVKLEKYQSGNGYHVVPPPYTGTFMPPKPDLVFHDPPNVNETIHTAFNVSDSEDDPEAEIPQNAPSFVQPTEKVRTLRNRKACFVCKSLIHLIKDCNYYDKKVAQTPARNHAQRGNHQQYARMTLLNPQRHVVPTAVLTKSKLVPITAARPVTVVPKTHVTRPRQAKTVVTKPHLPPRRNINHRPSPKASTFPPKVTAAKAPMGNPQHALKDNRIIDSGCSRHMTGNISCLSDFEELNGGYVAFGGNSKGGKISGKGKIRTGKLDFDDVYFVKELKFNRFGGYVAFGGNSKGGYFVKELNGGYVAFGGNSKGGKISGKGKIRTGKLDFDDVYFVKELKFNRFSVSQMCDKKNDVLFTAIECLVLSLEFKLPDENQVLLRVPRKNNMYNVDLKNIVPSEDLICLFAKATLDESNLWHRRTPSIVFMRPFGCHVTILNTLDPLGKFNGKVDEGFLVGYSKTDDDAAFGGKKPKFAGEKPESKVHSLKISLDNSINEVNAVDTLVSAVGQISTNSTNTFSAAGPSNVVVKLEDITYSDDKEDVGTEVDFTNLETTITVSPIRTTRVHKDHPVTQITVARIEAIRLFLAYAFFMGFMVYQMDVKSASLYGTIEEEVYVCQPLGFEDPDYPDKVYKVVKELYGLHQAPRAWYETLANYLLENGFQRGKIDQTLFIKRKKRNIAEILRKFSLTDRKSASTPIDTKKPLLKDPDGEDVDVHTYRSMIGSLMYLTSSRPDIMFVVCACARFQVTPKASHLHAVKMIFRYLKSKPHLGLWYPKDLPFNLVAYSDSDYAGASLDRKSTTGGC